MGVPGVPSNASTIGFSDSSGDNAQGQRRTIEYPESSGQQVMPLKSQEDRWWPAPLADLVSGGADAEQVADAILAIWLEIDQALHPIIGHRGVAALYNRSLHLTAVTYPWLAIDQPVVLAAVDPSGLRAALVQQTATEAAVSGSALFQTFHELLASLIGASLTDRLLGSVWTHSSLGSPVQDTSS
jgi:hypothetical protein